MSGRVIVVGSLNIDLVSRTPILPKAGETVTGSSFSQFFGGKGANVSVAAARVAGRSCLIGAVGDDLFGSSYIAQLKSANVDTSGILIASGMATGTANIFVAAASGENMIVVVPNANERCTARWVEGALKLHGPDDIVCAVLEVPVEAVTFAFHAARKVNSKTLLVPAPVPRDAAAIRALPWGLTDYLVCNQHELALLANALSEIEELKSVTTTETDALSPPIPESPLTVTESLLEAPDIPAGIKSSQFMILKNAGVKQGIVVTLGSAGAIVFDAHSPRFARVFAPRVESIDATGAGDAFAGALAVSLLRMIPLTEAANFATRYAAVTVTRAGAQASYPLADMPGLWSGAAPVKKSTSVGLGGGI